MESTKSDTIKRDSPECSLDAKQKKVLKLLAENLGVITQTCEEAKISRSTFYKWKAENPLFAQIINDIDDEAIDFVEAKLFERVKEKSDTMIIFYLKTKGKKRGYVEKSEMDINHAGELKHNISGEVALTIDQIYGDDTGGKN